MFWQMPIERINDQLVDVEQALVSVMTRTSGFPTDSNSCWGGPPFYLKMANLIN